MGSRRNKYSSTGPINSQYRLAVRGELTVGPLTNAAGTTANGGFMRFLLGIAMIAVCIGADAQGIHKCVGKDGKTAYSNSPCPGSKEIGASGGAPAVQGADAKKGPSAGPAAASIPAFPELQAGKWKLRVTRARDGRAKDSETCGDPIDGFRQEVQAYSANTKWGCTMTATASGPRSVIVVYDCPSDRSPDGRPVSKGRSELSLVSASPQAFRLEMKSTVYPGSVMEGTRIGDCEKR